VRGGDEVRLLLEGPGGLAVGDVGHDVWGGGRGSGGRVNSLLVWVLGAAKHVINRITLGHLRVNPDFRIVWFLD